MDIESHVFVGTEVGLLKGADIEKGNFTNLNNISGLSKDDEITSMCWLDSSEKKLYTGHRNQVVNTFNCETNTFQDPQEFQCGEGPINGIYHYNGHLVTAVESGIVKVWNKEGHKNEEINTGGQLSKMTPNHFNISQIATGGEESDLKIWDIQKCEAPIFKSKNVKNDFLDLHVPVWIMDIKFQSSENIITCTRHHQVRLYDTRTQRRPVIDMEFEKYPLMSLSLAHNDQQVVVGSSRGRMALLDLRKKLLVHVFKGFAGSIRCVQCHPTKPLVASCGLDRFLRIHDLNTRKLVKKIYMKTRLNCLLLKTDLPDSIGEVKIVSLTKKKVEAVDNEVEDLWESMSTVKEGNKQKRKNASDNTENTTQKKKLSR